MAKCIVCNERRSERYSSLCSACSYKQRTNGWVRNTIKVGTTLPIASKQPTNKEKLLSLSKWAFFPSQMRVPYKGVSLRIPYPRIAEPIIVFLMFVSILPVLILYAPMWIFIKIQEVFNKSR